MSQCRTRFALPYRTVRAYQYAGQTAHALCFVYLHNAVLLAYSTCDAAFHTKRILAVPARYRIGDVTALLDVYAREYRLVLERLYHIRLARICKCAVVFAKVTAQAPLFVNIYSFHSAVPPIRPRGRYQVSQALFHSVLHRAASICCREGPR